jgi:hypothetical protein
LAFSMKNPSFQTYSANHPMPCKGHLSVVTPPCQRLRRAAGSIQGPARITHRGDRLRGWGERTRTRKCRFTKGLAELLGFPEYFRTRDFSRSPAKSLWREKVAEFHTAGTCAAAIKSRTRFRSRSSAASYVERRFAARAAAARRSSARFTRHRSRLISIASRSGALASHSASRIACENSSARLMPRDVRTSTISYYCSGDSSRWRLANAGERSHA